MVMPAMIGGFGNWSVGRSVVLTYPAKLAFTKFFLLLHFLLLTSSPVAEVNMM